MRASLMEDKPLLILLETQNQNQNGVLGFFSNKGFLKKEEDKDNLYIPLSDDCFVFYYTK